MQRISRREWLRRIGLPFLGAFGAVAVACRSRVSPLGPSRLPRPALLPQQRRPRLLRLRPPRQPPQRRRRRLLRPRPPLTYRLRPPLRAPPTWQSRVARARPRTSRPPFAQSAASSASSSPGNDVIVKPNICVAYHTPEYAATTNPEVVATLVRLCLGAGARRVRVMDQPFGGTAEEAYATKRHRRGRPGRGRRDGDHGRDEVREHRHPRGPGHQASGRSIATPSMPTC